MIDTEKIRQFIALSDRKKALKDESEEVSSALARLQESLIPGFADDGVQRVNVDGRTVYLRREVRASAGGDMPSLVAAMKSIGLADFVGETIHAGRLSAWVKEFDPEQCLPPDEISAQLPEEVREVIKITETYDLRVTKS